MTLVPYLATTSTTKPSLRQLSKHHPLQDVTKSFRKILSQVQLMTTTKNKVSSGYTLTNIETQSWTVVTGLAAISPGSPPPASVPLDMKVRTWRCNVNAISRVMLKCSMLCMTDTNARVRVVSRNIICQHSLLATWLFCPHLWKFGVHTEFAKSHFWPHVGPLSPHLHFCTISAKWLFIDLEENVFHPWVKTLKSASYDIITQHLTKAPHPHPSVKLGFGSVCERLSVFGRTKNWWKKKDVFSDFICIYAAWLSDTKWLGWASNTVHERVSGGRIREQVSGWTVVVVWTDGWGNGVAGIQRGSFRNAGALIVLQESLGEWANLWMSVC